MYLAAIQPATLILILALLVVIGILVLALYLQRQSNDAVIESFDNDCKELWRDNCELRSERDRLRDAVSRARTSQRAHLGMFEQEAAKVDQLGNALRNLLVATDERNAARPHGTSPYRRRVARDAFVKADRAARELLWPTDGSGPIHNVSFKTVA